MTEQDEDTLTNRMQEALDGRIKAAVEGATEMLEAAQAGVMVAERTLARAKEIRVSVIRAASQVLSQDEIADALGLTTRSVAALTAKPRTKRTDGVPEGVEARDGHTGETIVTGNWVEGDDEPIDMVVTEPGLD